MISLERPVIWLDSGTVCSFIGYCQRAVKANGSCSSTCYSIIGGRRVHRRPEMIGECFYNVVYMRMTIRSPRSFNHSNTWTESGKVGLLSLLDFKLQASVLLALVLRVRVYCRMDILLVLSKSKKRAGAFSAPLVDCCYLRDTVGITRLIARALRCLLNCRGSRESRVIDTEAKQHLLR